MSNRTPDAGRLPSNPQWRARYQYVIRSLDRDTTRFKELTLHVAPTDLNRPHIDYMLRPSYVQSLAESIESLSAGLYNVEVHARYRHHRQPDWVHLNAARKHLQEAGEALTKIAHPGRTP